jgi:hypothetical protein
MSTSDKTHPSQFASLRLTPAERGNTNLRRARERDAAANGYFDSADEAAGYFDAQAAAEDDPRVTTPELREVLRENAQLVARMAAQDGKTRTAWRRQQELNTLIDRRDRVAKALLVERGKLGLIAELKAQVKSGYGQHVGRADMQAAALVSIGTHLIGLDATAEFIRSEILPQLDKGIAAAEAELKTFAAASPPS